MDNNNIQLLKLYNELVKHDLIKRLNIILDLDNTYKYILILFKDYIINIYDEIILGISLTCYNMNRFILETALINIDKQIIYDEDLGYVDVCKFSNINSLISHLLLFDNGRLYIKY